MAAKAARRLEAALRRGFTTVRDVAGGDTGLRMAIEEGLIDGPRYLFTGPGLTQTGAHGDARPGHLNIEVLGHHVGDMIRAFFDLATRDRTSPVGVPTAGVQVFPHPRPAKGSVSTT